MSKDALVVKRVLQREGTVAKTDMTEHFLREYIVSLLKIFLLLVSTFTPFQPQISIHQSEILEYVQRGMEGCKNDLNQEYFMTGDLLKPNCYSQSMCQFGAKESVKGDEVKFVPLL